ncbi:hypothetical protein IWW47_002850, partial [Coemansia sp. RSA 2052]
MSTEEGAVGAGGARNEDVVASSANTELVTTEAAGQPQLGSRGSSTPQPFLTETSPLPIRSSTARYHSVSARSAPYTVSHSPRTHLGGGDAANIPRTAQYHAVGTPARHPLGVQSEAMSADVAVGDVLGRRSSPMSMATTPPRPLPLPAQHRESGSAYSAGRAEAGVVDAATNHAQSGCLTPLGLDDDDDDEEYGITEPTTSSSAAGASAQQRASVLTTAASAESSTSAIAAVVDSDVVKCPICLSTICEAFMTACGHSFCYNCISRHLSERANCPSCYQALTGDQIYPNFALNQLIHSHGDDTQLHPSSSSIVEQIRSSVEGNQALDVDDIDTLLMVLQQKKQAMRSYERRFE